MPTPFAGTHTSAAKASASRRRILVINGKGGCGKSTIATNLAAIYALRGVGTALIDYDSQASSTDWAEVRDSTHPPIALVPKHRRVHMYRTRAYSHHLPDSIERVIIDTPSGALERNVDQLVRQCDIILIPMLPSPLDVRAGTRFITDLLTRRSFKADPRSIGVIANRLPQGSAQLDEDSPALAHALRCLDVPCVAQFRDHPSYTAAAATGSGVVELPATDTASERELAQWTQLREWLDNQPRRSARPAAATGRAQPTRDALRS